MQLKTTTEYAVRMMIYLARTQRMTAAAGCGWQGECGRAAGAGSGLRRDEYPHPGGAEAGKASEPHGRCTPQERNSRRAGPAIGLFAAGVPYPARGYRREPPRPTPRKRSTSASSRQPHEPNPYTGRSVPGSCAACPRRFGSVHR